MGRSWHDGIGRDLAQAGLKVKKVGGWKERGRPGTFSPRAIVCHHTASSRKAGNMPALGIVTNGRSDLPGPLAQILLARDGTVVLVAAGRANHAGYGGPTRGIPQDAGNAYSIGIEAENDGVGEAWSDKQGHAYLVLCAVLSKRLGQTQYRVFGHKEWTSRKIDPAGLDMGRFRKKVRAERKRLKRRAKRRR